MEAQSSFTRMIFVSISPSTTWGKGLETLGSPNSTWTKQLSYTKGNMPCSQQFFQHWYYMDMKFSSLVLRALESEEGWSKPGSPTKLTTRSPKPGRLSSAALNPSIHFPRGFLDSWRPSSPMEGLKPVSQAYSGLPYFTFRIFLGVEENWSLNKRFIGAISPTYFV